MRIVKRRPWDMPEREATPEALWLGRRSLLAGLAAGSMLAAAPRVGLAQGKGETVEGLVAPDLYPAARNDAYELDRPLTAESEATSYNNFYEFGSHKNIRRAAQKLELKPWQVRIDGLVEQERTLDAEDLIRQMDLEERLYRMRCVEAWAMAVPWTGFPLAALVDFARPLGSARYLRMETFENPEVAGGQKQFWYPWPYVEGLRLDEARNELAFIATGIYGKPMPKQNGAPIRLVTPWKYGFKSMKSIVRFSFVEERPVSFWEELQGREYGFFANVNPEVPHRRWSQAEERMLGTDEKRPTLLYNGYAEQVASLYTDDDPKTLFY